MALVQRSLCCRRTAASSRLNLAPHLRLQVGVLIIGAGPTGLGAATRLNQHGNKDWLLVDQVGMASEFWRQWQAV